MQQTHIAQSGLHSKESPVTQSVLIEWPRDN